MISKGPSIASVLNHPRNQLSTYSPPPRLLSLISESKNYEIRVSEELPLVWRLLAFGLSF